MISDTRDRLAFAKFSADNQPSSYVSTRGWANNVFVYVGTPERFSSRPLLSLQLYYARSPPDSVPYYSYSTTYYLLVQYIVWLVGWLVLFVGRFCSLPRSWSKPFFFFFLHARIVLVVLLFIDNNNNLNKQQQPRQKFNRQSIRSFVRSFPSSLSRSRRRYAYEYNSQLAVSVSRDLEEKTNHNRSIAQSIHRTIDPSHNEEVLLQELNPTRIASVFFRFHRYSVFAFSWDIHTPST